MLVSPSGVPYRAAPMRYEEVPTGDVVNSPGLATPPPRCQLASRSAELPQRAMVPGEDEEIRLLLPARVSNLNTTNFVYPVFDVIWSASEARRTSVVKSSAGFPFC